MWMVRAWSVGILIHPLDILVRHLPDRKPCSDQIPSPATLMQWLSCKWWFSDSVRSQLDKPYLVPIMMVLGYTSAELARQLQPDVTMSL